jgi:hypothetical protein
VVRHQPSKLTFAGSSPVSRSDEQSTFSPSRLRRAGQGNQPLRLMAESWLLSGPVAQWLAQATHNRLVTGSNPVGPTFVKRSTHFFGR